MAHRFAAHVQCSAVVLAMALLAQPALAQDTADLAPAPSVEAAHTATTSQVYVPDFFTRFTPHSALDMLVQVPGFVLRDDDGARGLGQATANVLVNGERLTSKTDDIFTLVGRIPASNVVRIEIVDAATLDVPGLTGQVANIIARTDGLSGSWAYRFEARPHFTNPLLTRFEASINGKTHGIEYTLGLSNLGNRFGAGGRSELRDAGGQLFETRDDRMKGRFDQPKATAAIKIDTGDDSVLNLNGAFRRVFFQLGVDDDRIRPGNSDRSRAFVEDEGSYNYEVGGDFTFPLGPGKLKLIGLIRGEHEPYSQESVFTYADGRPRTGDRYAQVAEEAEYITRAEYSWKQGGADWQLSAEAAFNQLNNVAELFSLAPGGEFAPVPFPEASGGVHEDRFESILSYGRPLSSKLSMQLTAGAEFSRLSQTGTTAAQRQFWRPKGSLSLAWAPRKGLDLSFKARRRVGQLEFGDFLGQVFLGDNNSNAGNGALVPPQSWEFELEAKQDLGSWGTTTLRLFDYRIEDLVDIIPVGLTSESPGNIDHAHRQGIEWSSTIQLAPLGLVGAKADIKLFLEKSRVRDPLTGLSRQISNTQDRMIEIEYRHDLPKTQLAYGFTFNNFHFQNYYRLGEVGLDWEGPNWASVFVEHKNLAGLTVRASINNIMNARAKFDRTVWTGWRDRSPVAFTERRDRLIGPVFSLLVKGTI